MAQPLYSKTLLPFSDPVENTELERSLIQLKSYLGKRKLSLLSWSEGLVAVPINLKVELPPLGNYRDVDIREVEPVLFVIDIKKYPTIPPKIYPDRTDFPKNNLAHLYVARKGKPPGFCLTRGDLGEWYSNKQIKDLVIRTANWLRDAATGALVEDGDQFDPLRLEGYRGLSIYDYAQLNVVVKESKSLLPDEDFAMGFFERIVSTTGISFRLVRIITVEEIRESFEELNKEYLKDKDEASKKYFHFGYILWSRGSKTYEEYCIELPQNWNEFKLFCERYGVDTSALEVYIAEKDLNFSVVFPVIVGIKRPKKLIGFEGNIEFINFYFLVNTEDVSEGKIVNNIPIEFQSHTQPLTTEKAKEISGFAPSLGNYGLIVGCGALGSKIVMHLARSGITDFMLTDPDKVSPHNLVRHALFSSSEGLNKAEALEKEIKAIFPYEKIESLLGFKAAGQGLMKLSKIYNWVLDFTASNSFFQVLVKSDFEPQTKIFRGFISDHGNLGILLQEGLERNPRVDDLVAMLYASHSTNKHIADWLKRENESEADNINIIIGIGCNSETTVLSDEVVSLHGSLFSGIVKSECSKEMRSNGRIYLNEIRKVPFFSNLPMAIEVPPMVVTNAINDPTWEIRIRPGIVDHLKMQMGLAMPHETGGVLVGRADYKLKTIHLVDFIDAPPDSASNPVCFFRGTSGLPEAIDEVNNNSGGQLGYIGEWHSHPFGPDGMSITDANTVRRFRSEFQQLPTPLPVFLVIVTPNGILPFVY